MYCSHCGKMAEDAAVFCPFCGTALQRQEARAAAEEAYYCLPACAGRRCGIRVERDRVAFSGQFLYLKDKEFYRNRGKSDTARLENFLGMGYLKQRSYRKTLLFVFSGAVMEGVKLIIDRLSELADEANRYLSWIGRAVSLPGWMDAIINLLALICLATGIWLFFSKKKVVEISFIDKRICIPQSSITRQEYDMLYHSILAAKKDGKKAG